MKVTIRTPIAGHADIRYNLPDHSFRPGESVELDDTLAQAWIESGIAQADETQEHEPPAATPRKSPARVTHHSGR